MRYPTRFALAWKHHRPEPQEFLATHECIIVRHKDVSWSRKRAKDSTKYGVFFSGNGTAFTAIEIDQRDLANGRSETHRKNAAELKETDEGDRAEVLAEGLSWYRSLSASKAGYWLRRILAIAKENGFASEDFRIPLSPGGDVQVGPNGFVQLVDRYGGEDGEGDDEEEEEDEEPMGATYAMAVRVSDDGLNPIIVDPAEFQWNKRDVLGEEFEVGVNTNGEDLWVAVEIPNGAVFGPFNNSAKQREHTASAIAGDKDSHLALHWFHSITAIRVGAEVNRLAKVKWLLMPDDSGPLMLLPDVRDPGWDTESKAFLLTHHADPQPEREHKDMPKPKQEGPDLSELVKISEKNPGPRVTVNVGGVSPLGQAIWPSIEGILEARLQVLRSEMLSKEVRPLEVKFGDKPKVELEGEHMHPAVMEALAAVSRGEDLFLVGPPGSGKTYMAEQMARMLGYESVMISFNEQTMTSDMFGRFIVNEKGGMDWHDGPVPAAFRTGKTVIIMDEVDRANPNTVDGLNSSIANRRCNLPQRRETLRNTEVVFVACANAYAADAQNTSSNTLAASFYDRFWRMEIGYDRGLEERFLAFNMPLLQKLWAIRDAVVEHKLRRHVSTRFVIRAAKASKSGMKNDDVLKQLVLGWRKEEKDKLKSLLPKEA